MRLLTLLCFLSVACATPISQAPPPVPEAPPAPTPPPDLLSLLLGTEKVTLDVDYDPESLFKVGRVRFDVSVTRGSADALIQWIVQAEIDSLDALVIEIDTGGGNVSAGRRVAKVIEESPVPIYCVVDGRALSMGIYILQSCPTRITTDRSVLMAHAPSVGMTSGNAHRLKQEIQSLEVLETALANHICHRVTLPLEQCRANFAGDKEWWLDSYEALNIGIVDQVGASTAAVVSQLRLTGGL